MTDTKYKEYNPNPGANLTLHKRTHVSASQLLNLATVPVAIVPGIPGQVLVPLVIKIKLNAGTIPYAAGLSSLFTYTSLYNIIGNLSTTWTIGGTPTPGDIVSLTFTGFGIIGSPITVSYTVQPADTLDNIAAGLSQAITFPPNAILTAGIASIYESGHTFPITGNKKYPDGTISSGVSLGGTETVLNVGLTNPQFIFPTGPSVALDFIALLGAPYFDSPTDLSVSGGFAACAPVVVPGDPLQMILPGGTNMTAGNGTADVDVWYFQVDGA